MMEETLQLLVKSNEMLVRTNAKLVESLGRLEEKMRSAQIDKEVLEDRVQQMEEEYTALQEDNNVGKSFIASQSLLISKLKRGVS